MTQSTTRRTRGKRSRRRTIIALQDRDVDILELVAKTSFCTSAQIARDNFPSIDSARRRLRRLLDGTPYFRVTVPSSTAHSLFSITSEGLKALKTQRPDAAQDIRVPRPLALETIAHHSAIVDVRLYVVQIARTQGGQFRWSRASGPLHQAWLLNTWRLDPDALFAFQKGKLNLRIAIEVDTGSESSRVLRNKLKKYKAATSSRVIGQIWWVSLSGPRRMTTIATLIQEAGLSTCSRLMTGEHVASRPLLPIPEFLSGSPVH